MKIRDIISSNVIKELGLNSNAEILEYQDFVVKGTGIKSYIIVDTNDLLRIDLSKNGANDVIIEYNYFKV